MKSPDRADEKIVDSTGSDRHLNLFTATGQRRTGRSEDGAVLVELAVVASLLVLLIFGALDLSVLVNHKNDLEHSATTSAREAVATVSTPTEDYYILQAIAADQSLLAAGTIQRVIIYEADTPDGKVPTACHHVSVTGRCNRYVASDLAEPKAVIDTKQTRWSPSSRSGTSDTAPFLGVYIESSHDWSTGILPWTPTLSAYAVMRIEPSDAPYLPITVTPIP